MASTVLLPSQPLFLHLKKFPAIDNKFTRIFMEMYSNTDSLSRYSKKRFDPLLNQVLYSPDDVDLEIINSLGRDPYFTHKATFSIPENKPVRDLKALFNKQIILDDETTLEIETLKVPGFIGIADERQVKNSENNWVSGFEDIARILERDGILICVYQWNRDLYGIPLDLRSSCPTDEVKKFWVEQTLIKNDGNHSFAIVPAQQLGNRHEVIKTFATLDQPGGTCYRNTFFDEENNGRIAVAQHLVFPDYITQEQALGYTNTIVSWMELLNCCVESPPVFDGSDPTRVIDRKTLKEFLKNAVLAILGESDAMAFFKQPENLTYCSEYTYICLNTPIYPFNQPGLTLLLDGDVVKANQLLELRDKHNNKQTTRLSILSRSPKFQSFNILMPVVSDDLPPLDTLVAHYEYLVNSNSLPFPPFRISHILNNAFHTVLPKHKIEIKKLVTTLAKLLTIIEPILIKQLQLNDSLDHSRIASLREYIALAHQQLEQKFDRYEEVDQVIDSFIQKIDLLFQGQGNHQYLVPPRIFVDIGQRDRNNHISQGWGFQLETIGALVYQGAIKNNSSKLVI
ncbi:MAG: hypothetical protein KA714_22770 [Limnoraphis sp. WC205]|nr:hypothetical protein [Limnoraphis sp. WC205]